MSNRSIPILRRTHLPQESRWLSCGSSRKKTLSAESAVQISNPVYYSGLHTAIRQPRSSKRFGSQGHLPDRFSLLGSEQLSTRTCR